MQIKSSFGILCALCAYASWGTMVAEWPLLCDPKTSKTSGISNPAKAEYELSVNCATAFAPLGTTGKNAFSITRDNSYLADFATNANIGEKLRPNKNFTITGWFNFSRIPEKGEVWMIVSSVPANECRWFLTLRNESYFPGVTWQIYSSLPCTKDSLLTTVTNPKMLTEGWHHFALSFSANENKKAIWRFYVDGNAQGEKSVDALPANTKLEGGGIFCLGGRGQIQNMMEGSLSYCHLWDEVLSAPQIKVFAQQNQSYTNAPVWKKCETSILKEIPDAGRLLPNGIRLPKVWPPVVDKNNPNPIKPPYLEEANIPKPIPIDVGRQLFVDDFLIADLHDVTRAFYKPIKHTANPVMWPETPVELAEDTVLGKRDRLNPGEIMRHSPGVVMPGGGVWWDPTRKIFRLWYLPGWWGNLSYAESKDGLHWTRPNVGPNGDNVLLTRQMCDTFSVWPNYATDNPYNNWCMSISPGGGPCYSALYTSRDGIHWVYQRLSGAHGDSTTLSYNPFLDKWTWSLRAGWRARSRVYHTHQDFVAGASWHFPDERVWTNTCDCALWLACDNAETTRTIDGKVYNNAQLYNVDAIAYESIMLGVFKILCGRDNDKAAEGGMPKSTSVHFAYSRDGFHYTRPDRTPAIEDSGWKSGQWDSGYVGPCSSACVIKDERLWFYYTGLRGDAVTKTNPRCVAENGMHWNGAIGVATLRRDGFVGLITDGEGTVTTRPVTFKGSHLFVNTDARFGGLTAEVLENGKVVPGFSQADCLGIKRLDTTKHAITWKNADLKTLSGKAVQFRFYLRLATLYSFWVSPVATGESCGYLAAGGPAYLGLKDLPTKK